MRYEVCYGEAETRMFASLDAAWQWLVTAAVRYYELWDYETGVRIVSTYPSHV